MINLILVLTLAGTNNTLSVTNAGTYQTLEECHEKELKLKKSFINTKFIATTRCN